MHAKIRRKKKGGKREGGGTFAPNQLSTKWSMCIARADRIRDKWSKKE